MKVKPFIKRGRVAYRNLLEALHATGSKWGFTPFDGSAPNNSRDVTAIDSATVGVAAYTQVKSKEGRFSPLHPPKKVARCFKRAQLAKVFQLYTDDVLALGSLTDISG